MAAGQCSHTTITAILEPAVVPPALFVLMLSTSQHQHTYRSSRFAYYSFISKTSLKPCERCKIKILALQNSPLNCLCFKTNVCVYYGKLRCFRMSKNVIASKSTFIFRLMLFTIQLICAAVAAVSPLVSAAVVIGRYVNIFRQKSAG